MIISDIKALQILDSRGNPTVFVYMQNTKGQNVTASCPSGASTGANEAHEKRDKNPNEYNGKGVKNAINNIINIIKPAVLGQMFSNQNEFDTTLINLDNSFNKENLGSNAILPCSIAFAKLNALYNNEFLFQQFKIQDKPLSMPVPMMNIINGGEHANNNINIQEFMIMPIFGEKFSDALRCGCECFQSLKQLISQKGMSTGVGDEGGFAPQMQNNKETLDIIMQAIEKANYKPGEDVLISLDIAASEIYKDEKYQIQHDKKLDYQELVGYYESLINEYPIFSIEDPLDEFDHKGLAYMTKVLGDKIQIVGDDVFTTNLNILKDLSGKGICNSILIKPNQVGTISETMSAIEEANKMNYSSVISHRSGETEDTTISHIAIGTGSGQIKTGSVCRGERVAKYNEILYMESLNDSIKFDNLKIKDKFNTMRSNDKNKQ